MTNRQRNADRRNKCLKKIFLYITKIRKQQRRPYPEIRHSVNVWILSLNEFYRKTTRKSAYMLSLIIYNERKIQI